MNLETAAMPDVFISYKREDREKARAIAEALAERGLDVWWDIELLAGQKFAAEINAVINSAKAAIVLWTAKSVRSHWVLSEASLALERNIIIPVWLEHVVLPVPFNTLHTLDLTSQSASVGEMKLDELYLAVNKIIGVSEQIQRKRSTVQIEESLVRPAHEMEIWNAASGRQPQSIREYRIYLEEYGDTGAFSGLARERIEWLSRGKRKRIWSRLVVSLTISGVVGGAVFVGVLVRDILSHRSDRLKNVVSTSPQPSIDSDNDIGGEQYGMSGANEYASSGSTSAPKVRDSREENHDPADNGAYGIPVGSWISGEIGDPGSVFRDFPDTPQMVVIPEGEFVMGSPPGENGRSANEGPQNLVNIGVGFALSQFEVTLGEWRQFTVETNYTVENNCRVRKFQSDDRHNNGSWKSPGFGQESGHPVVCVSFDDAGSYIGWLNQRLGSDLYRLPSEAEWEYAARATTVSARYWGDDRTGMEQCAYANGADATFAKFYSRHASDRFGKCDDEFAETSPVGYFGSNGFGLSDMLGNAAEWTQDCSHGSYSGAPSDGSAWLSGNGGSCQTRVIRGAAWDWKADLLRAAYRLWIPSNFRNSSVGFRLARDLVRTETRTSDK